MVGHVYFPKPDEEPPVESRFFEVERRGAEDSPEMVHLWAQAVLRQVDRYRSAVRAHQRLQKVDRYVQTVTSDEFFDAWCVERADLHFLMEAATQLYRWASLPDPADKAWEARRLMYDLPAGVSGRWVKTLRDALVHFDEAYRGSSRAVRTVARAGSLSPDLAALEQAAWYLVGETEPDYEP